MPWRGKKDSGLKAVPFRYHPPEQHNRKKFIPMTNCFLSEGYTNKTAGGLRWILHRQHSFLVPYLERIKENPGGFLVNIPRKHRYKTMGEFEAVHENRTETYLVKKYTYPRFTQKIKQFFKHTRGFNEFNMTFLAAQKGVPVEIPVAYGERKHVFTQESYIVIRKIKNSRSVREYFRDNAPHKEKKDVLEKFGRLAKTIHDAGIRQDAFSLDNFLVYDENGSKKVIVIDFEMVSILPKGIRHTLRIWYLAKLNREKRYFTNTDRLRFLLSYTDGDFGTCKKLAREIEMLTIAMQKKDAKKLSGLCTNENRKFGIFKDTAFSGYYNKRYPPDMLLKLLEIPGNTPERFLHINQFRIWRCDEAGRRPDCRTLAHIWGCVNALSAMKINIPIPAGIFLKNLSGTQQEIFLISQMPDNCVPLSQCHDLHPGKNLLPVFLKFAEQISPFGVLDRKLTPHDMLVQRKENRSPKCYLGNHTSFHTNELSAEKNRLINTQIMKHLLQTSGTQDQ
jgi:tRNA A-37 threonylcarbamoyl transferase component Bud32